MNVYTLEKERRNFFLLSSLLILFSVDCALSYPSKDVIQDPILSDGSEREEIAKNIPRIRTKPLTLAAAERETITFPCEIEDLGSLKVVWSVKKGSKNTQLYFGDLRLIQDDRINLEGTNLVIKNLNQNDTGIYACKVAFDVDTQVNHSFFVFGSPAISKEPLDGRVTLTKGQTLQLACNSNSVPRPDLKWHKIDANGNPLPSKLPPNDEKLIINNVGRQDAGQYRCYATSYVGESSQADFFVNVEEQPEVEAPERFVYTGIGQEVLLRCRVYGNPRPEVRWERVNPGMRLKGEEYKANSTETTLRVKINDEKDFGVYRCVALNKFGRDGAEIDVSGRPSKPIILNTDADFPTSGDEFELKYQVTSYSPITKILVTQRYSKDTEEFSDWNTTEIEANDTLGPAYNMKYNLQNMDRKTYEVKVYAENRYGRSESSEVYSITADGAKQHWKLAGSSSYGPQSSPNHLFTCLVLLITSCLIRI